MIRLTEEQYDFLNDYESMLEQKIIDLVPSNVNPVEDEMTVMTRATEIMHQLQMVRKILGDNDEW